MEKKIINKKTYNYSDIEIRLVKEIFDEIEDISYDALIEKRRIKRNCTCSTRFYTR